MVKQGGLGSIKLEILGFAGSLRRASYNRGLVRAAASWRRLGCASKCST